MRVADIWEKLYPLVVRLIKDMMTGGPGGPYLPLAGGTMTGQIVLDGFARVVKIINFNPVTVTANIGINYVAYTNSLEIPYDWDASEDMTIRFRWICNEDYATNSAEVQFSSQYNSVAIGEVFSSGVLQLSGDINIPATALHLAETTWIIDHDDLAVGDTLLLEIIRCAIDDGTDPVADVYAVSASIEYTANALGEPV
jgi:hypothetical protein